MLAVHEAGVYYLRCGIQLPKAHYLQLAWLWGKRIKVSEKPGE